jgi:hypothetical protein
VEVNFIGKATMAALVAVGVAIAPAQAASFVNPTTGVAYPAGTAIRAAGELKVMILGIFGAKRCTVSIDGEVLASGRVNFTGNTPGFVSNCDPIDDGAVQFPFEVAPTSATVVTAYDVYFDTLPGVCGVASVAFGWSNATDTAALGNPVSDLGCHMASGSYLTVTMPADIDIS